MKLALCLAVLVGCASAQVTGQCTGNSDPAEDVACDQGRHLIDPSTTGTTESDCCEDDTPCVGAWSTCAANCTDKVYSITAPATGAGAACEAAADDTATCAVGEDDCVAAVETVTGKCTGNTDASENVACPSGIPLSAATETGMLVSAAVALVANDAGVSAETCTGEIDNVDMHYPGDTCEQNFEANGGSGAVACAASCDHAPRGDIAVVVAVRESLGLAPSPNPGELRVNIAEICYHRDLDPGWEYWTKDGTTESECCAPEACDRVCQTRAQAEAAKAALEKCKNITIASNATQEQEARARLDCVAEELGISAGTIVGVVVASAFVLVLLAYCVAKRLCSSNGEEEYSESDSGSDDEETGKLNKKDRSNAISGSESGSEDEDTGKNSRSKAARGSGSGSGSGSEDEETGKLNKKGRSTADSGSESGSEDEDTGKNSRSKAARGSGSGSASEDEPPEPEDEPPEPEPEPELEPESKPQKHPHHHHHHHHHHHNHSDGSGDDERTASPERERAGSPKHHDHHQHHHHHHHH